MYVMCVEEVVDDDDANASPAVCCYMRCVEAIDGCALIRSCSCNASVFDVLAFVACLFSRDWRMRE